MRKSLSLRVPKGAVVVAGLVVTAVGLSGCSSLGSRQFGDPTVTGSVAQSAPATLNQPMPSSLGAPQAIQVAEQQFLPPAPVGSSWGGAAQPMSPVQSGFAQPMGAVSPVALGASAPTVQSQ